MKTKRRGRKLQIVIVRGVDPRNKVNARRRMVEREANVRQNDASRAKRKISLKLKCFSFGEEFARRRVARANQS